MKTATLATLLFTATALAAAVPNEDGVYLRRAEEVEFEGLPLVDLEVTDDENFKGMVFKGSAESIYNQMKELKPELFINEPEIERDIEPSAAQSRRSLETRQSINCGWYNNLNDRVGSWNNCLEGQDYLRRLGTAWCSVDASPACARLGHRLQVHCQDIPNDIKAIAETCIGTFGQVGGARDFSSHFIGLRRQGC